MNDQNQASGEAPISETPALDVGRGLTDPIIHLPPQDAEQAGETEQAQAIAPAEGSEENATAELPYDEIALATVRAFQQALIDAEHFDPNAFLTTIENGIFSPGIEEAQCIFLINRALRLLIIERRDVPEVDRNAALMGIVDCKDVAAWLPPLVAATIPTLVKYKIGNPGITFTPGEEPAYLKATATPAAEAPKVANSGVSGTHATSSALQHGSAEWKPEEVQTPAIETSTGSVVAKPAQTAADAAPCSTEPV